MSFLQHPTRSDCGGICFPQTASPNHVRIIKILTGSLLVRFYEQPAEGTANKSMFT